MTKSLLQRKLQRARPRSIKLKKKKSSRQLRKLAKARPKRSLLIQRSKNHPIKLLRVKKRSRLPMKRMSRNQ